MVTSVKAKPSTTISSSTTTTPSQSTTFQQPLYNIRVRFIGDDSTKALHYPAPYIEKFVPVPSTSTLANNNKNNNDDGLLSELYPDTFHVGDTVDALYQDGKLNGKWYRGRIANIVDDDDNEGRRKGRVCDVMYYDGDVSFIYLIGRGIHKSESVSLAFCSMPLLA